MQMQLPNNIDAEQRKKNIDKTNHDLIAGFSNFNVIIFWDLDFSRKNNNKRQLL